MRLHYAALVSTLSTACIGPLPADDDPAPPVTAAWMAPSAVDACLSANDCPSPPLALDSCDEPTYINVDWQLYTSTHFELEYPPGTAAADDAADIAAAREAAYANIRARLAIDAEPTIRVVLSPSRAAAQANHLAMGMAFEDAQRIEVVYTGDPQGFESVRYGHEVTHVLAATLLPPGYHGLPILDEGLAELNDQSHRDLHATYARKRRAGGDSGDPTAFAPNDLRWPDHARAGSLATYLERTLGTRALVQLFVDSAVRTENGCLVDDDLGCLRGPRDLEAALDAALARAGTSWDAVRAGWRAQLDQAARSIPLESPSTGDLAAMRALLAAADEAVDTADADGYRRTMEGFYCDWGGESKRDQIAQRMVDRGDSVTSELVALYDNDLRNFPERVGWVHRTDGSGVDELVPVLFERLPQFGWRVTWDPDWQ